MDFKVVFEETFLIDLESVLKWIAAQNPIAARQLGDAIVAAAESLSFFPERHPKVRQRPGIRRLIVQKYFKIFYRIDTRARAVEILCCWDARRGSNPSLG